MPEKQRFVSDFKLTGESMKLSPGEDITCFENKSSAKGRREDPHRGEHSGGDFAEG